MSRIVETNEADSLRAKVVSHMCEHFNEYSHLDRHIVNADVPNNKRYNSMEERIEAISHQKEMVGEIEVLATTKCLHRTIEVFVGTSKIVYGNEFRDMKPPIRLQFIAGVNDAGHYNSIVMQPSTNFITPQVLSPARSFNHKTRGRTTRSEVLTSSPYKRKLSQAKPRSSKRKTKAAVVVRDTPSTQKSWFCVLCEEDRVEDMIRCMKCGTWIHATCAGGISPNHTCDLC